MRRRIGRLCLTSLLLFCVFTPARAADSGPAPALVWLDSFNNPFVPVVTVTSEWTFSAPSAANPVGTPVLAVQLKTGALAGWRLERNSPDFDRIGQFNSALGTLVVEMHGFKEKFRLFFTDRLGRDQVISISMSLPQARAHVVTHLNCLTHGLSVEEIKNEAVHFAVGLGCLDKEDHLKLYFYKAADSGFSEGTAKDHIDQAGSFYEDEVDKPQVPVAWRKNLFRVGTVDGVSREAEYQVVYSPPRHDVSAPAPSRISFSAGLGGTAYSYKESANGVKFSENAVTGKASLGITLVRNQLDLALSGYGTLAPLSTSSKEAPAPRFYGINGRAGIRLPVGLGSMEYRLLAGWYMWGMTTQTLTDGKTRFGIGSIRGPQLYFMVSKRQAMRRSWALYAKYALISDGYGMTAFSTLSNREAALGGSYEITVASPAPWSVSCDIAHAQYANAKNGMKLLSVSLGIQKSF